MKMRLAGLPAVALTCLWACAATAEDERSGHVELCSACGTPETVIVWGRALEDPAAREPQGTGSRLGNLWRSAKLLDTDEITGRPVTVACADCTAEAKTDREGFFQARLTPAAPLPVGRTPVSVTVRVSDQTQLTASGSAVIWPRRGATVIISDFDDTLCETGVAERAKAAYLTLTGDATRMRPVRGMAGFLRLLSDANAIGDCPAPVFYVSGGLVNFQPRLELFLQRSGFPDGVVMLRNLGLGADNDPLSVQDYKLQRISALMELYDGCGFVLIGDSGEKDPEVYAALRAAQPDRVRAVMVRQIGEGDQRERLKDDIVFKDGLDAAMAAFDSGLLQTERGGKQ